MPKYRVELRPTGFITFEVEAATEEQAVDAAWHRFGKEAPDPEWDVSEVLDLDVEYGDDEEE